MRKHKSSETIVLIPLLMGLLLIFIANNGLYSQVVHYSGTTLSNVDYHSGQLVPAVGVHNIQVLRANREHPELADEYGWT